jgi:succinate dehydrogenase/fumarate reductase cytochrome b subunit
MGAVDPNSLNLVPEKHADDDSSYPHRQLIGYVGLLLPLLVWLVAGLRPINELPRWRTLHSISAYYYTGAVVIFAGGLVAMALFLFSYKGYANEYGLADRVAAIIAGCAAILAAYFPTGAPAGPLKPFWWTQPMEWIHHIAAVILFSSFIFFALVQFPKSKPGTATVDRYKPVRNAIYRICGWAIVICMLWIIIVAVFRGTDASIFLPETIALEAFAISWLVKGRADVTAKQALHYVGHPRELADKVRSKMRGARGAA